MALRRAERGRQVVETEAASPHQAGCGARGVAVGVDREAVFPRALAEGAIHRFPVLGRVAVGSGGAGLEAGAGAQGAGVGGFGVAGFGRHLGA